VWVTVTGDTVISATGVTTTTQAQTGAFTFGSNSGTNYGGVAFITGTLGALYLGTGVTQSSTNYVVKSGGVDAALNAPSSTGNIVFKAADVSTLELLSTGELLYNNTVTAPSLLTALPASDVATTNMLVAAQSAYLAAATNVTGGNITVQAGSGATTGGIGGNVALAVGNGSSTVGQVNLNISGTSTTYGSFVLVGTRGLTVNGGQGTGGASSSVASGPINITVLASAAATSGTAVGAAGSSVEVLSGTGAAGFGGNSHGGAGGSALFGASGGGAGVGTGIGGAGGTVVVGAGNGGNSVSTSNNANGGSVFIDGGLPGTGGSGTAGIPGSVYLAVNGTAAVTVNGATAAVTLANLGTGVVHASSAGLLTSSLVAVGDITPAATTGYVLTTTVGGSTVAWAAAGEVEPLSLGRASGTPPRGL
jgi:hypothetical protein